MKQKKIKKIIIKNLRNSFWSVCVFGLFVFPTLVDAEVRESSNFRIEGDTVAGDSLGEGLDSLAYESEVQNQETNERYSVGTGSNKEVASVLGIAGLLAVGVIGGVYIRERRKVS